MFLPFLREVPLREVIDAPENHHCAYDRNNVRAGFHATGLSPGYLCCKAGASCREVSGSAEAGLATPVAVVGAGDTGFAAAAPGFPEVMSVKRL